MAWKTTPNLRVVLLLGLSAVACGGKAGEDELADEDVEAAAEGEVESASSVVTARGRAAVFLRRSAAFGLGHVGWMFQHRSNPDLFCAGGVENPTGKLAVPPGGDASYWQTCSLTLEKARQAMRARAYDEFKEAIVSDPKPADAVRVANTEVRVRGYKAVGSNCADATRDVLSAYGVRDFPSLRLSPEPTGWFDVLRPTSHTPWSHYRL